MLFDCEGGFYKPHVVKRCLISDFCLYPSQRMALNSFQLFINQVQAAPELLKIRVLKIVFDILMVHEGEFLGRPGDAVSLACTEI